MNAGEIVYLSSDDEEKYMQQSDDDEIYEIKNEIKEPVVHEEILLEDSEEDDDDGFNINEIDVNETRTKLFVNYLPQDLTDDELMKLFVDVGPIKECWIFRDKLTSYSYGYGVVEYELPEDANKALKTKNKVFCQGKELLVIYSRDQRAVGAKLFFKNAGPNVTEEQLKPYFEPFGHLIFLKLLVENDIQTGNGFAQFENRFQAAFAIKQLNEQVTVPGSDVPMTVGFAEEHGKQKSKLFAALNSNRRKRTHHQRRDIDIQQRLG